MRWQPWVPGEGMPRLNKGLVYLGACIIAGMRLARERQVHAGVIPTSQAVDESIELSHEIFTRVFRRAGREPAAAGRLLGSKRTGRKFSLYFFPAFG